MNTKTSHNLKVGFLAAIIVISFGYTGYSLMYPPKAYLGQDDKVAMEFMLDNVCPFLKEQYDALEIEGQVEWDGAVEIVEECNTRVEAALFEEVLIQEFSKHYSGKVN